MTIQDIMNQIGALGISEYGEEHPWSYEDISNIQGNQIQTALEQMFNIPGMLSETMFQPISPLALGQTYGKAYSPMVETAGGVHSQNLMDKLGGKKAREAYGGFAGSGQQQRFTEGAKDVYGKEMSGVLSDVGRTRTSAISGVSSLISDWKDLASQIAG